MMRFNGVEDTDVGVTCVPQAGVFLSSPDPYLVDIPTRDGALWVGGRQQSRTFPITLVIQATSQADLSSTLDVVAAWLSAGPAPLVFSQTPDRAWMARLGTPLSVVNAGPDWQVRQDLDMIADDPHPYALTDNVVTLTAATGTVNRVGNAPSWPTITIKATLTSTQTLTLTLWGQQVTVTGPLAANETAVLDYQEYMFYVLNAAGSQDRLLTSKLSTLDRIVCPVGGGAVARTVAGGTVASVMIACNSRWL